MKRQLFGIICALLGACQILHAQSETNTIDWSHSTFPGLIIIISPTQKTYRLGEKIEISATISNTSNKPINMRVTEPYELDYVFSLSYSNETKAKNPDISEGQRQTIMRSMGISVGGHILDPTKSRKGDVIDTGVSFKIKVPGIYYVQAARFIAYPSSGYLISNKIKILVEK